MTPRLASGMLVAALIRRAHMLGGSGAVLMRGDDMAGGIIVILAQRGENKAFLERGYTLEGRQEWRRIQANTLSGLDNSGDYLSRRRAADGDLWAIELDVADAERFAAEMAATG